MSKDIRVTEDNIAHALVCVEFITNFETACELAGGGSWNQCKGMTLEAVMNLLAPNGIQMLYVQDALVSFRSAEAKRAAQAFRHLAETAKTI